MRDGWRRLTRTANGITTLYIGGVYEVDAPSGVARSEYAFGGGVVAQRTVAGASNTVVYLHGDHLGSVSVATSSAGAVLDRQEYGPWGNIRSGTVSETSLNYTGQKRDGTGLLYYGARYYDPALGRFLSPDTMGASAGNPQSLNRYSYVGNNPLNHTDPSGHCFQDECDPEAGPGGGGTPGINGSLNGDPPSPGASSDNVDLTQTSEQIASGGESASLYAFLAPPDTGTGTGTGTGGKIGTGLIGLTALLGAAAALNSGPFGGQMPNPNGQPSSPLDLTITPTPEPRAPVVVQLQQQIGGNTITLPGDTIKLYDLDGNGVTVDQVLAALDQVRDSPNIPKGEQRGATQAYNAFRTYVENRPPYGISGRTSWPANFDPQNPGYSYRFDLEVYVGTHLRM